MKNDSRFQKILESELTEEDKHQSPPVDPIPKNTENESDKPSPAADAADIKSLRVGCLSV